MKTEEKNEIIAEKFLKWKFYSKGEHPLLSTAGWWYKGKFRASILNFHKDRNQQKLIEDKLVGMGDFIQYTYDNFKKEWEIFLDNGNKYIEIQNKSKDIAFIDVIIELINDN